MPPSASKRVGLHPPVPRLTLGSPQSGTLTLLAARERTSQVTMCHNENFVNPLTGVHTQAIESYWNKHKMHLKQRRGTLPYCLNHHLAEFMFRERHEGKMLSVLFSLIDVTSSDIDY